MLGGKCKAKIAAAFCALAFVSCASVKDAARYPVHVTNTAVLDLLPPSDTSIDIDGLYGLTMKSGKDAFSAMAYLTSDDTGVYATLLNDFGMSMTNLAYDGESLTLDSVVLPKKFKAQYIVLDLQFALYGEDAVRRALQKAGLKLKTEGNHRTILKGKKVIEIIEADGSVIKVNNVLRGYELIATEAEQ